MSKLLESVLKTLSGKILIFKKILRNVGSVLERYFIQKPIPKLKTAFLNLEFGIINEFLMEDDSEILIDLRLKLILG